MERSFSETQQIIIWQGTSYLTVEKHVWPTDPSIHRACSSVQV